MNGHFQASVALTSGQKNRRCYFHRGLSGAQGIFRRFEEDIRSILPLPGIEARFLGRASRNPVSIP